MRGFILGVMAGLATYATAATEYKNIKCTYDPGHVEEYNSVDFRLRGTLTVSTDQKSGNLTHVTMLKVNDDINIGKAKALVNSKYNPRESSEWYNHLKFDLDIEAVSSTYGDAYAYLIISKAPVKKDKGFRATKRASRPTSSIRGKIAKTHFGRFFFSFVSVCCSVIVRPLTRLARRSSSSPIRRIRFGEHGTYIYPAHDRQKRIAGCPVAPDTA